MVPPVSSAAFRAPVLSGDSLGDVDTIELGDTGSDVDVALDDDFQFGDILDRSPRALVGYVPVYIQVAIDVEGQLVTGRDGGRSCRYIAGGSIRAFAKGAEGGQLALGLGGRVSSRDCGVVVGDTGGTGGKFPAPRPGTGRIGKGQGCGRTVPASHALGGGEPVQGCQGVGSELGTGSGIAVATAGVPGSDGTIGVFRTDARGGGDATADGGVGAGEGGIGFGGHEYTRHTPSRWTIKRRGVHS